jgi:hypothetical protein
MSSWEVHKVDAASLTLVNLYFNAVNLGLKEGRLLKTDIPHIKYQLRNRECHRVGDIVKF